MATKLSGPRAAALALATASGFAMSASADDQPQQYAAVVGEQPINASVTTPAASSAAPVSYTTASGIVVEPYARTRAIDWAAETDGVAVSVALGIDSQFTPEDVQSVLYNDFVTAGEPNVAFFFSQNDVSSTMVTYHYGLTGGGSSGALTLNESQDAVQNAVDQNHFYEENPELGI